MITLNDAQIQILENMKQDKMYPVVVSEVILLLIELGEQNIDRRDDIFNALSSLNSVRQILVTLSE